MVRRASQPSPETLQLPILDRFQRLDALAQAEGFMPTSMGEQNEVMMLDSTSPVMGGAAQHLAEVIKHQSEAATDDPRRAVRKITHNYVGYAQDAKRSAQALADLQTILADVLNPGLTLDVVVEPTQSGLLEFLRYFDMATLRDTRDLSLVGYDPMKVNYVADNGGIMYHLGLAMEAWRVNPVRTKIPDAIADQRNRQAYFEVKLEEVVRGFYYPALQAIALKGLDDLRKVEEPKSE